jgi:hypothetical protein
MKIIKKISLLMVILSSALFTSCDEGGDPDAGGTTTAKYAGEWYIDISKASGAIIAPHILHSTYNTSANDNTMWIDDKKHGYELKSKIITNLENGTFSSKDAANIIDANGTFVTITEGKIIHNGGKSKGGHVVDSIAFKAEFSYDPGIIINFNGVKRTGFSEDEY